MRGWRQLLLAVCLLMVAPIGASAMTLSDFLDYIGELSGPGPLRGTVWSVEALCVETDTVPSNRVDVTDTDRSRPLRLKPAWQCHDERRAARYRVGIAPVFSLFNPMQTNGTLDHIPEAYQNQAMKDRSQEVGADNREDGPNVTARPLAVRVTSTLPGATAQWVRDTFEFGGTAGALRVGGTGVDPFFISMYEFPNVLVRPLPRRKPVIVEVGWTKRFIGAVNGGQFGGDNQVTSESHVQDVYSVWFRVNKPGWEHVRVGINLRR